jgi:hypothetical protein
MFSIKGVHDAMTERSPSYAILAIDSEDRFKDYEEQRRVLAGPISGKFNRTPYDFQITKNESLMNGFFTRLALTELNFPWVIPNINERTQEIQFTYKIGAAAPITTILTLDVGFYRPDEIATELETQIKALDPALATFFLSYGTDKLPRFIYNTVNAGNLVAFEPLDYNSGVYPFPSTTKQLFDMMGFTDDNTVLGANNVDVDTNLTYCQAIRYIDIVCSQLTYNQALKDTMSQTVARDTLCRLYLGDGPYTGTSTIDPADAAFCPPGCAPFTIYRQFTNPKFIRWLPNQPVQGNLRFQVFDDDGQPLASYTGTDVYGASSENWSMTLLVSED